MTQQDETDQPLPMLPRTCRICGGTMRTTDTAYEGYQPVGFYECQQCGHKVKLSPMESASGWLLMGGIAWAVVSLLLWIDKFFDVFSVIWIVLAGVMFLGWPVYQIFQLYRYPAVNTNEASLFIRGVISRGFFLVLLFVGTVVLISAWSYVFE